MNRGPPSPYQSLTFKSPSLTSQPPSAAFSPHIHTRDHTAHPSDPRTDPLRLQVPLRGQRPGPPTRGPAPRHAVSPRDCPSRTAKEQAAKTCRAFGESQSLCSDRPRVVCPSQRGSPSTPPGQTATSRFLPALLQPSEDLCAGKHVRGGGLPLPLDPTLRILGDDAATVPSQSPPSPPPDHPEIDMPPPTHTWAHPGTDARACRGVHIHTRTEGCEARVSRPVPTRGALGGLARALGCADCEETK